MVGTLPLATSRARRGRGICSRSMSMHPYPVRIVVTDDLVRSRLTVFFRAILAIPHYIWAFLLGTVVALLVFVNWFILLVKARTPDGIHGFVAGYIRYLTHLEAYFLLAADPYPGFYLIGSDPYPVDLEIDPPQPQSRWKTVFRLFLAVPASCSRARCSGAGRVEAATSRAGSRSRRLPGLVGRPVPGPRAARAPRPARLLPRLQRAGLGLPVSRHRPLPVQRARACSSAGPRGGVGRGRRRGRSRSAPGLDGGDRRPAPVETARLLPAADRHPASVWAVLWSIVAVLVAVLTGSGRSSPAAAAIRSTASSRATSATRPTSTPFSSWSETRSRASWASRAAIPSTSSCRRPSRRAGGSRYSVSSSRPRSHRLQRARGRRLRGRLSRLVRGPGPRPHAAGSAQSRRLRAPLQRRS